MSEPVCDRCGSADRKLDASFHCSTCWANLTAERDRLVVDLATMTANRDDQTQLCGEIYDEVIDLRAQLAATRAALEEALNRWEWFAQRFRDRIGGLDAANEHDYPRIAELRKVASEP